MEFSPSTKLVSPKHMALTSELLNTYWQRITCPWRQGGAVSLKMWTHCLNQPWRTEDADCRNWHCALAAPFNNSLSKLLLSREDTRLSIARCDLLPREFICSLLPIDLISPKDFIHWGYQVISTAPNFFLKTCVGTSVHLGFINLLNWPGHLNFLWNETTDVCYFWHVTCVWTDDTAWTSTLKTPLCPSTHFIGGVWDGIFWDGKKNMGIIFLLTIKQKVCLHEGL